MCLPPWWEKVRMRGSGSDTFTLTLPLSAIDEGGLG